MNSDALSFSFGFFETDCSSGVDSGSDFASMWIISSVSWSWDRFVLVRCGGSRVISSAGMSGTEMSILLCSLSRNGQFTMKIVELV